MSKIREMLEKAAVWQGDFLADYEAGCIVCFGKEPDQERTSGIATYYPEDAEDGDTRVQKTDLSDYPRTRAVVVGVDVREYSRREYHHQLIITAVLNATILKAIRILRDGARLAGTDPSIIVHTGDGAMVVFDSWEFEWEERATRAAELREKAARHRKEPEKVRRRAPDVNREVVERAFDFVFVLNALIAQDNERQAFQIDRDTQGAAMGILPIHVRFALTLGEVLLVVGPNEGLNCVGKAMVTCARILATDHGNHLMVEDTLLHQIERHGGLGRLGDGEWEQSLHGTELPERRVKSGEFRYADVFGHYSDAPLLRMLNRRASRTTQVHIGSHDVAVIDKRA